MKAKIGGFLHLAVGEEATVVGTTSALADAGLPDLDLPRARPGDRARHRPEGRDGRAVRPRGPASRAGRGGSMHLFDAERRFMGGYGIVGGNLPLAAGVALASDYRGEDAVTLCMFGDGASNQGTFGETMNLAALWKLPVVFLVVNNQYGMGTALVAPLGRDRPLEEGRVPRRSRASASTGWTCSRCASASPSTCASRARSASRRWSRRSPTGSAATRPPTPRSTAPRRRSQQWRERDPIVLVRATRLKEAGYIDDAGRRGARPARDRDRRRGGRVRGAEPRARRSSRSTTTSTCSATRSRAGTRSTSARPRSTAARTSARSAQHGVAHELAEAGAAYAGAGDVQQRRRRERRGGRRRRARGSGGRGAAGGRRA